MTIPRLPRRTLLTHAAALAAGAALPGLAHAADAAWPARNVRVVVPFPPGGATDITARLIAEKLAARLGQPFVVDNRGGAGGITGTDAVAKAAPDGLTLLLSLSTSLLINQYLYSRLPYHPRKDLALLSQIAMAPVVLAVHPDVPAKTGPELLAWVKANKGKVSYGSWGVGSYAHLGGAAMSLAQDADMSHVAYRGEAPMLQDLIGGQIQMAFASALGAKPHAESGRLRLIGVTGDTRMVVLPQLPTLAEQGLTDEAYRIVGFVGMAAPAKTPPALLARISSEVQAVVALPDVRERLNGFGFQPVGGTPAQFAAAYDRDAPVWERLVKQSGAKAD
ncbi:MAG: tripartite tricarboxylate transporter substrate binding protein [Pseudomonadota bacterium]|nr:tripartite tricarboxylate transporter substrate binding protein [Pseudomonadota bacterium]